MTENDKPTPSKSSLVDSLSGFVPDKWLEIIKLALLLGIAVMGLIHGGQLTTIDKKADSATTQAVVAADRAEVAAKNAEQTKKATAAVVETLADQTLNPKAIEAAKEAKAEAVTQPTQK